jgi:hypothetical protein
VDPEVVTQFNCLQQTGQFCPSNSNGPMMKSISPAAPTTMGSPPSSRPAAADAFFALVGMHEDDGMPEEDLGPLVTLSHSRHDPLAVTLA